MKLIERKQVSYGSNNILDFIVIGTSKNYMEIYLKTEFIWSLKSLAGPAISFDSKHDEAFTCVLILKVFIT